MLSTHYPSHARPPEQSFGQATQAGHRTDRVFYSLRSIAKGIQETLRVGFYHYEDSLTFEERAG